MRFFGVHEGLAQSQVMAITQDTYGYLWVATQGGLSRYNGHRFDTSTMTEGLPDNTVTAVAADASGGLWFGTDTGAIGRWDGNGFSSWPGPEAGQPTTVTGLCRLDDGTLLVGTGKGLYRWTPDRAEQILDAPVTAIDVPESGDGPARGWTGPAILADAVYLLGGTTAGQLVEVPTGLTGTAPVAVARTLSGVWVADAKGTILHVSPAGVDQRFELDGVSVRTLLPAREGGVWVGASDGLRRVFPDGSSDRQPLHATDPEMEIRSLYEDRESNLWISPWSGGLYQLRPHAFAVFDRTSGFPAFAVWGFLEDEQGCMWMATEDVGVLRWCHDGRWLRLRPGVDLPEGRVLDLETDRRGGMWIATSGGIVHRPASGPQRVWTSQEGLPDHYARVLLVEEDGSVWAATRDGVAHFDGRRWRTWGKAEGLADSNLRGLARDRNGVLWIGSHNGGVASFDGARFTPYSLEQGLPHQRVWTVAVDSRNRVWAGTDAGIWVHPADSGPDFVIGAENGLPNLSVLFLIEDPDGFMWAGTTNGVCRIDPDGRIQRTLSTEDGLPSAEAAENAAFIDSSGQLWAGVVNGVVRLDPAHLPFNQVPPQMVLERIVVDGAPWPATSPVAALGATQTAEIEFPPSITDLTLEYSALSFTSPERVRYRYKLEGYDADFSRPSEDRHVIYRHLPPRRYQFLLTACNSDGIWSERPLAVSLRVLPTWYQTGWFKVGSVIAGLTVIVTTIWASTALHRRRRRELERLVAERTTELASANLRISDQNRQLEELSRTDPLTGLGNRRVLMEQAPLEVALIGRQAQRIPIDDRLDLLGAGLYMIDLDHFKSINDRWGHEVGDSALQDVARTLKRVLREVDLAVRWGGEEFVVLARGIDRPGVTALAIRLLDGLARTRLHLPSGDIVELTASVGFVPYPLTFAHPLAAAQWPVLLDAADRLLYLAKERGRRRACGIGWLPGLLPDLAEEAALRAILADPTTPPDGFQLIELETG